MTQTPASYPVPDNEIARLASLHALKILDTGPSQQFDSLVKLGALSFGVPICVVSLIDAERQWFKSAVGLAQGDQSEREVAFCAHTIMSAEIFEVPDATKDARFASNPLVQSEPHVRFYAGIRLLDANNHALGTFCIIDMRPRRLSSSERDQLMLLADAATAALREHELRVHASSALEHTLRNMAEAVLTLDLAGNVTHMNPVSEQLTGWLATKAMGTHWTNVVRLVHETNDVEIASPVARCIAANQAVRLPVDAMMYTHDDQHIAVTGSAAPVCDNNEKTVGTVLILADATTQRTATNELSRRARQDALTGLLNRSEFELQLQHALAQAKRDHHTHTLLFIDLDKFKAVNDTSGHAAGDELLRSVGGIIERATRQSDVVARLGGDEFGVLLRQCSANDALKIGSVIRENIFSYQLEWDGHQHKVGMSAGLALIDESSEDAEAVLRDADSACYSAKAAGGARVHLYAPDENASGARQAGALARLYNALEQGQFRLFGQRITPLQGVTPLTDAGAVPLGLEILLRLPVANDKVLSPNAFLPLAERHRLAATLDLWVLQSLMHTLQHTSTDQSRLDTYDFLAINITAQTINDDASVRQLGAIVDASPGIAAKLCFEVSEESVLANRDALIAFMEPLRERGCRFTLDNFGGSLPSYQYLVGLPFEYIKIDGSFVRDSGNKEMQMSFLRSSNEVAQLLGARTVAMHVESEAVHERMMALGVNFAQGFFYGRPQPIEALLGADS